MTPLLFDPGDRWEYGSNMDWYGQVVEGITGKRLGEVFRDRIFEPLGIDSMTFELNEAPRQRLAIMHARNADDFLFFSGLSKSWSFSFMVNDGQAPIGRSAGALGWAGLVNLFYWIDRQNGHGGFWATQILPFADPTSFTGYMDFEKAYYECTGIAQAA